MEDTMFNDLLASVGEAKEILQHKKKAITFICDR